MKPSANGAGTNRTTNEGHHLPIVIVGEGTVRYSDKARPRLRCFLEAFACLTMQNLPNKFHSCQLIPSSAQMFYR